MLHYDLGAEKWELDAFSMGELATVLLRLKNTGEYLARRKIVEVRAAKRLIKPLGLQQLPPLGPQESPSQAPPSQAPPQESRDEKVASYRATLSRDGMIEALLATQYVAGGAKRLNSITDEELRKHPCWARVRTRDEMIAQLLSAGARPNQLSGLTDKKLRVHPKWIVFYEMGRAAKRSGETQAALDAVDVAQVQASLDTALEALRSCGGVTISLDDHTGYAVFDKASGEPLFVAEQLEEGSGWFAGIEQICCAPYHSYVLAVKVVPPKPAASQTANDVARQRGGLLLGGRIPGVMWRDGEHTATAMMIERDGRWCSCSKGKPWMGCCICDDRCKNEAFIHAGAVDGLTTATGRTPEQKRGPTCIGSVTQPIGGGGFTPTVYVMEREGTAEAPFAKTEGSCLIGGLRSVLLPSTLKVWSHGSATTDKLASASVKRSEAGSGLCDGLSYSAFARGTTVDLDFQSHLTPKQKALLIASLLSADGTLFERLSSLFSCRVNMCDPRNRSRCTINCCSLYFYGCLLPCKVTITARQLKIADGMLYSLLPTEAQDALGCLGGWAAAVASRNVPSAGPDGITTGTSALYNTAI